MRELLRPLFALSLCSQQATVVAGTTCEGAVLASVVFFGLGSASHGVGRHEW